jgi:DNA-binding transcriptional ArsR family regulator
VLSRSFYVDYITEKLYYYIVMQSTKGKRKSSEKTNRAGGAKSLTDAHLSEVAQLLGVLSEVSRLRLLRSLMERSMTVSELVEATGMQQGNVSKHLGVLLSAGVVAREPEGNFARYSIADSTVSPLCDLMCARVEERARQRMWRLD